MRRSFFTLFTIAILLLVVCDEGMHTYESYTSWQQDNNSQWHINLAGDGDAATLYFIFEGDHSALYQMERRCSASMRGSTVELIQWRSDARASEHFLCTGEKRYGENIPPIFEQLPQLPQEAKVLFKGRDEEPRGADEGSLYAEHTD